MEEALDAALEELRIKTYAAVVERLEKMLSDFDRKNWHLKCPNVHVAEMVKLYHQAKSLEK